MDSLTKSAMMDNYAMVLLEPVRFDVGQGVRDERTNGGVDDG
jgi:hypothetical protein